MPACPNAGAFRRCRPPWQASHSATGSDSLSGLFHLKAGALWTESTCDTEWAIKHFVRTMARAQRKCNRACPTCDSTIL